jgi:hypothetical protein
VSPSSVWQLICTVKWATELGLSLHARRRQRREARIVVCGLSAAKFWPTHRSSICPVRPPVGLKQK